MATQGDNNDVQTGTSEQVTQRLLSQLLVQVEGMIRRMDLQDQELSRLRTTQPATRQGVPAAIAEGTREDLPPSTESRSRDITDKRGSEVPPPAEERGSLQLGTGQPSTHSQHGIRAPGASEGQHHLFRHDA